MNLIWTSLVVLALCAICVNRVGAHSSVIVGPTRQLFFDDHVVESMDGLKRTVHPATKYEGNPVLVPDKPWETTANRPAAVIYNPDNKLYEMWYYSFHEPHSILNISYAWSEDGINWTKPLLDTKPNLWRVNYIDQINESTKFLGDHSPHQVQQYFAGLPPCNIVLAHTELQGVVYTPDDPDPGRRYKSAIFGGTLIYSGDGIHWRIGNTFYPGQLNVFNYDPARRLYFGYFIYPPYGVTAYDGTVRRVLGFSCSHDLVRWTGPSPDDVKIALPLTAAEIDAAYRGAATRGHQVTTVETVIIPDQRDDELTRRRIEERKDVIWDEQPDVRESHFYGMSVLPYEGVYIGFPVKLDVCGHLVNYGDDGPMQVELAFSRDLRHWQREDRTLVIPNGPVRSWDGGRVQVANQPLIRGDEVWFYYGGDAFTHGWPIEYNGYAPRGEDRERYEQRVRQYSKPTSGIGIAKWRLDGFVSLDASEAEGTLVTKPLYFSGTKLEVNADASGGSLSVELEGTDGKPIDGYALAECDRLRADAVHHIVSWRGKTDLTLLAGKPIRVRFVVRRARLYAFGFVGEGPSRQAAGTITAVEEAPVDLEREIEVGPEIVTTEGGKRMTMYAANQRCARCGGAIGEFDPARVFDPPVGETDRVYFHVDCAGRVKVVGQGAGR